MVTDRLIRKNDLNLPDMFGFHNMAGSPFFLEFSFVKKKKAFLCSVC